MLDSGKFLISTNAGPSDLAGRLCNPNFFSLRGQNDMLPIALGKVMNERGVKRLYIMAPNYAAGNDMAAGVERTFAGEVVGRDFTKWGEDPQLDFSAEFAKVAASGADALFAFYPGRASAFARQFEQSGLAGKVKLYSVYTMDQIALPQRRMKVVIMVSRFGHCVNDLLHRWRIGALPIDMVAVISSHLGYQNIESSLGLRGIPIASCPSSGNLVNLVG